MFKFVFEFIQQEAASNAQARINEAWAKINANKAYDVSEFPYLIELKKDKDGVYKLF